MESEVDDNDDDSNFHNGTTDVTVTALAENTTNGAPSNCASSCPARISCEVQHEDNSPSRKRKSASDSCATTKRKKKDDALQNE